MMSRRVKTAVTAVTGATMVAALWAGADAAAVEEQIVYVRVRDMAGAVLLLPVFDPRGHPMRYEVMVDETDAPVRVRDVEARGGKPRYFAIEPDPNGHIYFRLRALAGDGRIVFDPVSRPSVLRTVPARY